MFQIQNTPQTQAADTTKPKQEQPKETTAQEFQNTIFQQFGDKVSAGVIEKHIDIYDETLMEEPIVHEGSEGQYYKIDPKTFEGFDLVETKDGTNYLPDNAEGHMSVSAIEISPRTSS